MRPDGPRSPEWRCPTCGMPIATRFCPRCGESRISPREQTLRGLAERLFQAFTSIDTRTARSVWALMRRPGELTASWMKGVRKTYVAPITLFLLVNVLFFAVQSWTGQTVFSSSLDSHLHHQNWSAVADSIVQRKLAATVHDPRRLLAACLHVPAAALLPRAARSRVQRLAGLRWAGNGGDGQRPERLQFCRLRPLPVPRRRRGLRDARYRRFRLRWQSP